MPLADALIHPLHRRCTHRGQETRPTFPLAALGAPRPEREPQERKLYPGVAPAPIAVLAIHHARFLWVHFQLALLQPIRNRDEKSLRLSSASAVGDRIVGVADKWTLRMLPLHPSVEGVMHEQVHQHRSDH